MYEHHFGLKTKPFALSPDPRFLYQKATHREALASLIYGIHERRGFIALVGEVGTGKTTLINALLELFNYSMRTILISHTTLDREELLSMVLHQLSETPLSQPGQRFHRDQDFWMGDGVSGLSRVEMLHKFYRFAREERAANRPPPLLLIDEAQNLSIDVLEEIRLLTNLETAQQKLLQVVLVGQPELEKKLRSPSLRALRQRIAVYSKLEPLSLAETVEYVCHRMTLAGCTNFEFFSHDSIKAIWRASGGIPRAVNILCDQCLLNTYGAGEKRIDEFLTAEAIRDTYFSSEAIPSPLELGGSDKSTLSLVQSERALLPDHDDLWIHTHSKQRRTV